VFGIEIGMGYNRVRGVMVPVETPRSEKGEKEKKGF
jgi:hypothetical protein